MFPISSAEGDFNFSAWMHEGLEELGTSAGIFVSDLATTWSQNDEPVLKLDKLPVHFPIDMVDRVADTLNAQQQTFSTAQNDIEHEHVMATEANHTETDNDSEIWTRQESNQANSEGPLSWDRMGSAYQQINRLTRQSTPYLTEWPMAVYDAVYESTTDGTSVVVSEDTLVQCLLYALHGIPSVCFRWNKEERRFQPRSNMLRITGVSSVAMTPVIQSLLQFGTHMKNFELVALTCLAEPNRFGSTGMAFARCLSEFHLYLEHSLSTAFDGRESLTTIGMHQYLHSLKFSIEKLATFCHLDNKPQTVQDTPTTSSHQYGFHVPFGSHLLNALYNEIKPLDFVVRGPCSLYKDICMALLCHTSDPLLTMISDWIGLGRKTTTESEADAWSDMLVYATIQDPYKEFFIQDVAYGTSSNLETTNFVGRFQLRHGETLPFFIDRVRANMILQAGRSLRLLRLCQPNHPLCTSRWPGDHSDLRLRWLSTQTASERYMRDMNNFALIVREFNANIAQQHTARTNAETTTHHCPQSESQISEQDIPPSPASQMDTDMDTDSVFPRLPPLRESDFTNNDFSNILHTILEHHQNVSQAPEAAPDHYIPTIDTMVRQSLHYPLETWCPLLNESAMCLFIHRFQVQEHLKILHRYFLFGDRVFQSGMVRTLFGEVEAGITGLLHNELSGSQWPPRASDLSMTLRAILLESMAQIPDDVQQMLCKPFQTQETFDLESLVTFVIREGDHKSPWRDPKAVEALDFLALSYHIQYPISVVITQGVLEKYSRIFTFLLQVQRIHASIKSMFWLLRTGPLAACSPETKSLLHHVRFQMNHFAETFSRYLFDSAIGGIWIRFMEKLERLGRRMATAQDEMDEDDALFASMNPIMFGDYHEHMLDRMLFQCFSKRNQRSIKLLIFKVFNDILTFSRLLWQYDRAITTNEYALREQCEEIMAGFTKHMVQLLKVLEILHSRGVGRLGNVMNSLHDQGSSGVFGDLYDRIDAKSGHGTFVKDLLTRLNVNDFYNVN